MWAYPGSEVTQLGYLEHTVQSKLIGSEWMGKNILTEYGMGFRQHLSENWLIEIWLKIEWKFAENWLKVCWKFIDFWLADIEVNEVSPIFHYFIKTFRIQQTVLEFILIGLIWNKLFKLANFAIHTNCSSQIIASCRILITFAYSFLSAFHKFIYKFAIATSKSYNYLISTPQC